MNAVLSAAKAWKKAFGLVGASFAFAIAFLVIDPLRQEAVVQGIPAARFVSMDYSVGLYAGAGILNSLSFRLEHEGQH